MGILGPRQCGKTTLARDHIATLGSEASAGGDHAGGARVHYFDLEDPEHLNRLTDPRLALESLEGLIVIDEIQRSPELFPLLRVLVDRERPKQRYLILGSASRDLIRQSSETLAGRIIYLELPPFTAFEAGDHNRLWLRGGFPPAYLASADADSMIWRKAYVTTFLERDLPNLGIDFAAGTMRRFWMMVAHWHGNILNASEFARSLDVSSPTIKRYLDILDGTFITRTLQPWYENIAKRQVKSPKILFRDSGILHALLNLPDQSSLHAHPKLGASWEGFALEQVIQMHRADAGECFFWATHGDAELDLLIVQGTKRSAFEFKYTSTPRVTRSMHSALEDLKLDRITIVTPGDGDYPLAENVKVACLRALVQESRGAIRIRPREGDRTGRGA